MTNELRSFEELFDELMLNDNPIVASMEELSFLSEYELRELCVKAPNDKIKNFFHREYRKRFEDNIDLHCSFINLSLSKKFKVS